MSKIEQKPLPIAVELADRLDDLFDEWRNGPPPFSLRRKAIAAIIEPVLKPLMECRETLSVCLDLFDGIAGGYNSTIADKMLILGGTRNLGREQLGDTQHLEHGSEGSGSVED